MASLGSHAREGIQGHYYLPLPVYDFCSLQDRRCAHMAHRSVEDPAGQANELAPHRGPHPELPPLADHLTDTVAQARAATQASTDTTPVESIPGSSIAPSFCRTAPLPTLVPLSRV